MHALFVKANSSFTQKFLFFLVNSKEKIRLCKKERAYFDFFVSGVYTEVNDRTKKLKKRCYFAVEVEFFLPE